MEVAAFPSPVSLRGQLEVAGRGDAGEGEDGEEEEGEELHFG